MPSKSEKDGEHIIIEVQLKYEIHFDERIIYETCKEIASQIMRNSEKPSYAYKLEPVYVVSIVHFMRRHTDEAMSSHNGIVWEYDINNHETGVNSLK